MRLYVLMQTGAAAVLTGTYQASAAAAAGSFTPGSTPGPSPNPTVPPPVLSASASASALSSHSVPSQGSLRLRRVAHVLCRRHPRRVDLTANAAPMLEAGTQARPLRL
jgi:hypothetical protein